MFIWYRTKVYDNLNPGSYYYKMKQAMTLVSHYIHKLYETMNTQQS